MTQKARTDRETPGECESEDRGCFPSRQSKGVLSEEWMYHLQISFLLPWQDIALLLDDDQGNNADEDNCIFGLHSWVLASHVDV